jgi:hypothetical protein
MPGPPERIGPRIEIPEVHQVAHHVYFIVPCSLEEYR